MSSLECAGCGVTAGDLIAPDMLEESEAEDVFTHVDGVTFCTGCAQLPDSQRLSHWV